MLICITPVFTRYDAGTPVCGKSCIAVSNANDCPIGVLNDPLISTAPTVRASTNPDPEKVSAIRLLFHDILKSLTAYCTELIVNGLFPPSTFESTGDVGCEG